VRSSWDALTCVLQPVHDRPRAAMTRRMTSYRLFAFDGVVLRKPEQHANPHLVHFAPFHPARARVLALQTADAEPRARARAHCVLSVSCRPDVDVSFLLQTDFAQRRTLAAVSARVLARMPPSSAHHGLHVVRS
jgi:hypothetical protein